MLNSPGEMYPPGQGMSGKRFAARFPIYCGASFEDPLKLLNGQSVPGDQPRSGDAPFVPQYQSPWQFIEEEPPARAPEAEPANSLRPAVIRPPALPMGPSVATTEKTDPTQAQAESWEGLARRPEAFRPEAVSEPGREEAYEDESDAPDTGLSGLRKLLLSPGLKGVNKAKPLPARVAEAARPLQETPAQRVPARSYTPFPGAPAGGDRSAQAQESLPPKAAFESEKKEHAWADGENTRRDRRDPVDPVEILPSWRGQYKKKKK